MAIPYSLPSDGNSSRQRNQLHSNSEEVKCMDSVQPSSFVLAAIVQALDILHCLTSDQCEETDNGSESTSESQVSQQKTEVDQKSHTLAACCLSSTYDIHKNVPDTITEAKSVAGAIKFVRFP